MDSAYLNEVLAIQGDDLPNISNTIVNLINHTNILKKDVTVIIQNQSHQFNAILKENERLKSKVKELLSEKNLVEDQIEKEIKCEISSCAMELEAKSYSLKEINLFLNILKQLLDIDSTLKRAKKNMKNQKYYECAKLIQKIQDCIKFNSDKFEKIEIFKVLSQEVILTYENFLHKISEIWSECVNIDIKEIVNEIKNVTEITLSIKTNSIGEIIQILKASNHLKSNLYEKKFGNKLLNDVLNKIIVKKANVIVQLEERAVLFIEILNNEKKPHYMEVFKNLKTTIEFLKSHLDFVIQNDQTFLSIVGSYVAEPFADSIIKNILCESIPSSSEGFENYKGLINNAEDFEKSLQNIGFLPSNSSSLMEYARNINVLYANKFCQSFLIKAKSIMKNDLHNITTSEEVISNVTILPVTYKYILKTKMNIQEDIFLFPKCQISRHAKEFIDLLHSMMTEIEKTIELCAVRLFYTIRNIFEMYAAVVPLHHKKFLESLPQQVALFHNNCMYFAHNLINTVMHFYDKNPYGLKSHFPILLEEAINLRRLAAKKLELTISNQRNQLIYILRDSGFAMLKENPKLDVNSEKSLRQCMRQLQILQTVWNEVLPLNIYNRAIGFLLDGVIEELITLIMSVEDISSQTSSDLVSSFNIILERAPNLFQDGKEIHRHVRKWQKFKEFVLIVKGSLRDIDDRWASGMGPLAVEFTAEQVKHLIRALFQNSDRRAALLARIK